MKKCCPFCFSDENIKELVFSDDGCSREEYDIGKCDICGAEGVRLYELSPDSELSYQFGKLFDVFVPESFEEQAEHLSSPKALFEAFTDTWDVFRHQSPVAVLNALRESFFLVRCESSRCSARMW